MLSGWTPTAITQGESQEVLFPVEKEKYATKISKFFTLRN
jgi:hypothetical protein